MLVVLRIKKIIEIRKKIGSRTDLWGKPWSIEIDILCSFIEIKVSQKKPSSSKPNIRSFLSKGRRGKSRKAWRQRFRWKHSPIRNVNWEIVSDAQGKIINECLKQDWSEERSLRYTTRFHHGESPSKCYNFKNVSKYYQGSSQKLTIKTL